MLIRRLVALALCIPLAAQAQDNTPTFRISTRIVVLDVVVTDKQGHLVTNLPKDAFTIYEDQTPETIRSFEPPSAHLMPATPNGVPADVVHSAADLKKIGDAPVTILVLDELNTRFEDMSFARQSMTKYLSGQPAILRQPTNLLLATNTHFVQVRDYTQDRDTLLKDVKSHIPEFPWRAAHSGKQGFGAVERMAQTLASLEQIAQASTGTPGRKNVIWVGSGFLSSDLSTLDLKTADTIETAIRQVTNMLLAARVTLYTIDPTANTTTTVDVESTDDLQSSNENGGDPFGIGSVAFSNFAPATGGKAFVSRNDINNEIAEGINTGNSYYTLSYSPVPHTDQSGVQADDPAKFRKIRIVMNDKNLRATTRQGYYPVTGNTEVAVNPSETKKEADKQAAKQLQLDLSQAVTSTISYNGLNVTAVKGSGGVYTITATGPNPSSGLTWQPNGDQESAEATVLAAWFDNKGKVLGHVARELNSTRQASTQAPATFSLQVSPAGGATRLRFVVRDAISGQIGTTDLTKF